VVFGQAKSGFKMTLKDIETKEEVTFNDIYTKYNLDKSKPTVLISWSGNWCPPCLKLIKRYNDIDPKYMNLITVNIDEENKREAVFNKDLHKGWNNAINLHANLGGSSLSFDNLFNIRLTPMVMIFHNGNINTALVDYDYFPWRLVGTSFPNADFIQNSPQDLFAIAEYYNDIEAATEKQLSEAIEYIKKAIELEEKYEYAYIHLSLLYRTEQYKKGLEVSELALKLAKKENEDTYNVTDLVKRIKGLMKQ
jgi:thiol-disulfide isomerase/thioredoxin